MGNKYFKTSNAALLNQLQVATVNMGIQKQIYKDEELFHHEKLNVQELQKETLERLRFAKNKEKN